ncbi:MAG: hypothetical protein ACLFV0_12540, partial [Nitriliruptoraceae bacterium]
MPAPDPDPDDHRELRWRRAHLVTSRWVTWPDPLPPGATARLHVAFDGGLRVAEEPGGATGRSRIVGADAEVVLRPVPAGLPPQLAARDGVRHLADRTVLALATAPVSPPGPGESTPPGVPATSTTDGLPAPPGVPDAWLGAQLAVSITDADGRLLAASGVQHALATSGST